MALRRHHRGLPARRRRALAVPLLAALAVALGGPDFAAGQNQSAANSAPDQAAPWGPGPMSTPYGDYLAARHAEAIHDTALAARLFERVLRHAPNDPAILRQAMHQMLVAGEMAKAVEIAKRYIKFQPMSVLAGLTLAVDDMRAGRNRAATFRLQKIPDRGLGGYIAPLVLAWAQAAMGDTSDAIEALVPFGKRRGLKTIHDLHAALIREQGGDTGDARELYANLIKGETLHLRLVELVGAFYERQGDAPRAIALYEKFLKAQRSATAIEAALARAKSGGKARREIANAAAGAAEALWDIATLLSDQNVDEVALMLTRMALHLRPDFAIAQIQVGDILVGMRRYGDAVAAYDQVARADARSWEARLRAADTLSRAEKIEPALKRLAAMAEERSARPDAVIARGDILRFKKRYEEALTAYDKAFARIKTIEKRHWSLYYSRAITLERSKRWERAEKDFLKALELRPNQPYVLNYLGYSWVEKGMHLKRALGMIERAVRLRPNDGFIVDSLGWAHYRLGAFDKAVKYLERAITLSPGDAAINDHLGDAYWRVGRRVEARFQWDRALRFDPEPEIIDKVKKKLAEGLDAVEQKSKASGQDGGRRGG